MRWTASALKRDCAYPNVLKLTKPRKPTSQLAIDKGVIFHAAVESWIKTGQHPLVDDLEIQGWIDLLASQWTPPAGTMVEIAWGLTIDGRYVHVEEPKPHVYVPMVAGVELMTAGRADAAWVETPDRTFPDNTLLRIVDWKTGRWPVAPARENLQALAGALALAKRFRVAAYQPGIYYAQDGAWDWGDVVALPSAEARADFEAVDAAAQLDDKPHPGDHCAGCWERKTCPASVAP